MRTTSAYRSQAIECCQLARAAASEEHRRVLIQMAATWLSLAKRRERMDQIGENAPSTLVTTEKIVALTDKIVALKAGKHVARTTNDQSSDARLPSR